MTSSFPAQPPAWVLRPLKRSWILFSNGHRPRVRIHQSRRTKPTPLNLSNSYSSPFCNHVSFHILPNFLPLWSKSQEKERALHAAYVYTHVWATCTFFSDSPNHSKIFFHFLKSNPVDEFPKNLWVNYKQQEGLKDSWQNSSLRTWTRKISHEHACLIPPSLEQVLQSSLVEGRSGDISPPLPPLAASLPLSDVGLICGLINAGLMWGEIIGPFTQERTAAWLGCWTRPL